MSGTRVRRRTRAKHADRIRRNRPAAPSLPETRHADPFAASVWLIAAREASRFRGKGMRIGSSTKVHAVGFAPWLEDSVIPVPACHAGFDPRLERATPAGNEVTCGNCLRRTRGIDLLTGAPHGQEALFPLPLVS